MLRDPQAIVAQASLSSAADAAPPDYLDVLNAEQCRAVLHECDASPGGSRPLLIIAGAGSGKTNTLAYRVAHLVCRGADPGRILLLTFSRRAAAEMERRAGRILQRVLGLPCATQSPALLWSGTFHSVGARLLREYAERIGLSDSFTIHDRSDSEDLLAIARHESGFSTTGSRFPGKATCLAIYSRVVNAQAALGEVLRSAFPWCAHWEDELTQLFAGYTASKQAQNVLDYDDLLLYWAHAAADPALAREMGGAFRSHPRRRVSGHQSPAGADPALAQARWARRDGGRRRRTVDLFLPRGDGAQHPRFSGAIPAAGSRG